MIFSLHKVIPKDSTGLKIRDRETTRQKVKGNTQKNNIFTM